MASNIFSRFNTGGGRDGRSFYDELRSGEGGAPADGRYNIEERAGLAVDEENLNAPFHDYDLDDAGGLGIENSRVTLESAAPGTIAGGAATSAAAAAAAASSAENKRVVPGSGRRGHRNPSRSRWAMSGDDDADADDVPGSLLVEPQGGDAAHLPPMLKTTPLQSNTAAPGRRSRGPGGTAAAAIPGPSSKRARAQWETTQKHQRLHRDDASSVGGPGGTTGRGGPSFRQRAAASATAPGNALISYLFPSGSSQKSTAYDRAMWRWVNVTNLDNFIRDVYNYYRDSGLRCIMLARFLHLINVAFVAIFLTFLTQCVEYDNIRGSTKMEQILVPQCTKNMSWLWNIGLWLFTFYFIWKTMQFFIFDVRRLLNLRDFFVHLLQIPEHDMQTVSWQDVVVKIMALRDQNPKTATNMTRLQREWIGSQSKERLDAHDIANRLMRRENYLIALFNKDILDLTVPLPFLRNKQFLTRTLEWTLWFGVLDFVFDERGQVSQEFLRAKRRSQLCLKLRSRFLFAGFMNLLLAPFVACYLVVVYFLTYYNEYQKNPSALGARAYTPLAEWKFREFNELEHLFEERLNMSYPFATRYLDQFPKKKTEQVAKTVAFIAGAVMTVLAIASLVDPELFLGFEITHDRTVLFYVGIFATVWATARGMITEDNSVFDPEYALRNVIEYTHYEPDHWKGRLHSNDVKTEFSDLYQLKIKIFLEEILSIFFTPLILFTSLPRSSEQIIDFFREFTIHVDGLGYVCSFAVFDFHKGVGATSNPKRQPQQQQQPPLQQTQQQLLLQTDALGAHGGDVRDDYYATKHGKMAASYYGFLDNYVINPKTGIPGHHPPGTGRHHGPFHPPPAFPGLNSPTMAADVQGSRIRHRGPARTPHLGPASMAQPSPMASVLLDPHHQPSALAMNSRSMHWTRMPGGAGRYPGSGGESYIVEEPTMEAARAPPPDGLYGDDELALAQGPQTQVQTPAQVSAQAQAHVPQQTTQSSGEGFAGGPALLDESTWQTTPPTGLSREASGVGEEEADVGVLGLMYQFQQAHQNHRIR